VPEDGPFETARDIPMNLTICCHAPVRLTPIRFGQVPSLPTKCPQCSEPIAELLDTRPSDVPGPAKVPVFRILRG
jgi:hypothetical protein